MAWLNRYGEAVSLTRQQIELLSRFGLPCDFENLTDKQYFAIDKRMSDEIQLHGIAGDDLNDYGKLCESVILALPE